MSYPRLIPALLISFLLFSLTPLVEAEETVDFNRDIRPILSNKCYTCHGPDNEKREAGLRLDSAAGSVAELESGEHAVVPGKPMESALIARVTSDDEFERMPPEESGQQLSAEEIDLLTKWIESGANYATHWSYIAPERPAAIDMGALDAALQSQGIKPPNGEANWQAWAKNDIDRYLLARMVKEKLHPSPAADKAALVRRLSLDLTGLPPTLAEVDQFLADQSPDAYEKLVDRLLAKEAYGEHWARQWLDLARYADSAGYADDPLRTIWAYRDYVIRSLNGNKPFDSFTIEQIAGDMLESPTDEQLLATAFHRNTLTNNEGGTNDEEFRNVAVVDRVNTTMAVWMGTTINCCQCHTHKYDPITQEEYFRLFAIFNNTEDADRRDESPLLQVVTGEQRRQQEEWQGEIAAIEKAIASPAPEILQGLSAWEDKLSEQPAWQLLQPAEFASRENSAAEIGEDGAVFVTTGKKQDVYTLNLPLAAEKEERVSALQIETLPDERLPNQGTGYGGGNFVITHVKAALVPPDNTSPQGRFLRIEIPGDNKILSLAEVHVFSGSENIATAGEATQSSTDYNGPAKLAIDGNTNGDYNAGSVTHTASSSHPWWELDLKGTKNLDRIVLFNRTDGTVGGRLSNFHIIIADENRNTVWRQEVKEAPSPSSEFFISNVRSLPLAAAYADYSQSGFEAGNVVKENAPGWAIGGQPARPHQLTLALKDSINVPAGSHLLLTLEQTSPHENHTLGKFRVRATAHEAISQLASLPANIAAILKIPADQRNKEQSDQLTQYYLAEVSPELAPQRKKMAELKQQLAGLKPATTAPIMRELPPNRHRKTHIQIRGDFLTLGKEVMPGLPAAFPPLPAGAKPDRLALARWLVDDANPLTARVVANRYWESIFGRGIVLTSEEFGSQGDLPTHPQLLDWLAVELMAKNWDLKAFLKLLVTSAAYRQSSAVTEEQIEQDSSNVFLARGPRFRMSAEMIRDQALAVSGLLSPKMYGPPVNPPQPKLGLSAAFGGGTDWNTSAGEDKHRRGLYTTWRRSNPYPSMSTFDAPNREVCTIRRDRTNTPLQALVTLNDPVYIEAAQALAKRMMSEGGKSNAEKAAYGFRLCLARPPSEKELTQIIALFEEVQQDYAANPAQAKQMLGEQAAENPIDQAAWTVVGNVILNLDEMFMKR